MDEIIQCNLTPRKRGGGGGALGFDIKSVREGGGVALAPM